MSFGKLHLKFSSDPMKFDGQDVEAACGKRIPRAESAGSADRAMGLELKAEDICEQCNALKFATGLRYEVALIPGQEKKWIEDMRA